MHRTTKQSKSSLPPKGRGASGPARKLALSRVPLAYTAKRETGPPSIRTAGGSVTVSHREFVRSISVGQGGKSPTWELVGSLQVNPGIRETFPWLSGMANNYEEYRFTRLAVDLVPRVPATHPAVVGIAVDYDAQDLPPSSKEAFLGTSGAVSGPAWAGLRAAIRGKRMDLHHAWRFTRRGEHPDLDLLEYDACVVHLMVDPGFTDVNNRPVVADVFLEYEVQLQIPQIRESVAATIGQTLPATGPPASVQNGPFGFTLDQLKSQATMFGKAAQTIQSFLGAVPALLKPFGIQKLELKKLGFDESCTDGKLRLSTASINWDGTSQLEFTRDWEGIMSLSAQAVKGPSGGLVHHEMEWMPQLSSIPTETPLFYPLSNPRVDAATSRVDATVPGSPTYYVTQPYLCRFYTGNVIRVSNRSFDPAWTDTRYAASWADLSFFEGEIGPLLSMVSQTDFYSGPSISGNSATAIDTVSIGNGARICSIGSSR